MFFSTIARTQLQAMQMTMLFILPSVLLSGFIFPRASMPPVIQYLGNLIPLTYFLDILRGIMLKGVGIEYLWNDVLPPGCFWRGDHFPGVLALPQAVGVRGVAPVQIRERILRTMKELAGQKGFHAVTTDELAAASGVSKRTLYRHFKSKDAVIEAVLDDLMATIERRAEAIVAGAASPPDKLRGIVRAVLEGARFTEPRNFGELRRYYPHLWEKIDRFRSGRVERLRDVYLEGCRLGYFREVDPDVPLTAYLAALRAVIYPDFLLAHAVSMEQAFDTLLEIFLHGIARQDIR